ncbi:putative iron-dependent peroxidase [Paucimonas lemoignei]|uniref:Putative iron-dependent peroxidase n=1 Tax=Paucimonas lemoignei TaxID=29443 RepID=A0A4R3HSW8_PAULE|nr:Dyp-type peroxidase [Paucimonas lemoignei]TCS35774.1 putative iron-dependent peroxidase [Paucimonas lemoignei]
MKPYQPAILDAPIPAQARHLFFKLESPAKLPAALDNLARIADGEHTVVGLGEPLVQALGRQIEGLRAFPAMRNADIDIPSTQHALWCWLRGDDRGELLHRTREVEAALAPALRLVQMTEAFRYKTGHDLTGYEDGTENPQAEDAFQAAISSNIPGSSFAAVQHWAHDLDHFARLPQDEQDNIMGRRKSDNEELDDAPESAHVKRTAQESFSPEAFVVRRSMPWAEGGKAGLLFLAFGRSLDAFEAQLRRMAGLEDGITDALFRFSQPVSGGYYWCPPISEGRLDLRAVR